MNKNCSVVNTVTEWRLQTGEIFTWHRMSCGLSVKWRLRHSACIPNWFNSHWYSENTRSTYDTTKGSMYICGLDNLEIAGSVPGETREFFSFFPKVQPSFGAHQCRSLWIHEAGEREGVNPDHSPLSHVVQGYERLELWISQYYT